MKERKEESINSSLWTPSTPQPLHGKLKKNHQHFLDNPLIHLFEMTQEEVHNGAKPSWMRKCVSEGSLDPQPFAMEALRSQSQGSTPIP